MKKKSRKLLRTRPNPGSSIPVTRAGLSHHWPGSESALWTGLPILDSVLRSQGQPLDSATRAIMQPRFGHDFSQVRVHADSKAAKSAQAVNALAYTVRQNIAFGVGQYAPGTTSGQRLLAHELSHSIQHEKTGSSEPPCISRQPNPARYLPRRPKIKPSKFEVFVRDVHNIIIQVDPKNPEKAKDTFLSKISGLKGDDVKRLETYYNREFATKFSKIVGSQLREDILKIFDTPLANELVLYLEKKNPMGWKVSISGELTQPGESVEAFFDGRQVVVSKNNKQITCAAFTGSVGEPTPAGKFLIRRQGKAQPPGGFMGRVANVRGQITGETTRGDRSKWFLLEPQFETARSKINLHYGARSSGCITVTDKECFDKMAAILNSSGTVTGTGYDGYPPGNEEKVVKPEMTVDGVGWMIVKYSAQRKK